jgi:hypothetical protein
VTLTERKPVAERKPLGKSLVGREPVVELPG